MACLSSLAGYDCCSWKGVRCSKSTAHVVKLDLRSPCVKSYDMASYLYRDKSSSGRVEALEVSRPIRNDFIGRLPRCLSNVTSLELLDLSENGFGGAIPSFGEMTVLYILNLWSNSLGGRIPVELCQLRNLQLLHLAQNNISGGIPSCFNNLSSIVNGDIHYLLDSPGYERDTHEVQEWIVSGNNGLCGHPLTKNCSGDHELPGVPEQHNIDANGEGESIDLLWFYRDIGLDFAVGFLGACVLLYFKQSGRHSFPWFDQNIQPTARDD
ncbi:hypothetical protein CRG98_034348 [Punica granatum]|uniref:Leucine-rich repeat-containing N-terminal plant-type domain-containing protein n=1 Tax=Punica granatum TaxID=22663 RepID=A0A2I0IMN2_PUNGR|nr:hypothetical protein CRG98_034348 [Punica granatum]